MGDQYQHFLIFIASRIAGDESWTSGRSSHRSCSVRKGVFRNVEACHFIKKETLAQVFSCEFCKIFEETFFTEHLWTTSSENKRQNFYFDYDLLKVFLNVFSWRNLLVPWNVMFHTDLNDLLFVDAKPPTMVLCPVYNEYLGQTIQ